MNKILFVDGQAPALNAQNLNQLQDNVEEAIGIKNVVYNDSNGTNGSITFSETISNAKEIEIIYCRRRANNTSVYKSTGKIPYYSGIEIALDINYYSSDTNQQSISKIVAVSDTGLTVSGGNTLQGNDSQQAITSATNNIFITKIIAYF